MLHLVDASVYIFRAYFSLPDSIRDPAGNPVQAVYGFTRFLVDLLARQRPRHIACAFDESLTSSFRNRIYPPYKTNRALPPPELEKQLKACRRAARALGIATFASRRYEADDLIGTLAKRHGRRRTVVVVSRDKDLAQLIRAGDVFWDYAADERHDAGSITAKLGVPPARIPDLLGLAGDAVDNIPGVAGIGAKTAVALLAAFDSLDMLYANLDRVASLSLRGASGIAARLAAGRDAAFLSRELATIHCDVPLNTTLADLRWSGVNDRALSRFFNELGFGASLRQQVVRLTDSLA
ncbi:MAG TPA: 5'-3' exonuclease H3TH domain-containing protein [Gammaproteobacteria bacterium]